jgi:hypothetical protein
MKMTRIILVLIAAVLPLSRSARAQGTVTFNQPWHENGIAYAGLYFDNGISFRVSDPSQLGASMALVGVGLVGHPSNGTPHLEPASTLAPGYVLFSRTNAASFGQLFTNGLHFGLISVDLADTVAPSLSPVAITFNGFKAGGVMVSQTFTVGGGGSSSFQKVYFGSDFAGGLLRVEIPSPAWAMDNIVWIPEPSGAMLMVGSLLFLALRRGR